MNKKEIKITAEGKESLPWNELLPFQGQLKHIEKAEYEKLRKVLIEMGFSFAVHAWKHKGKYYIIDGHQRMFAVKQMVEVEGYSIKPVPVVIVQAKTFNEAKKKVLAAASQYGKISKQALSDYAKEFDVSFDDLVSNFHFPEIDFSEMEEFFSDEGSIPDSDESSEATKSLKSGSDQVKQLQLFFSTVEYEEFLSKIESLKSIYKTENVTDTLLELIREKHKAQQKTK